MMKVNKLCVQTYSGNTQTHWTKNENILSWCGSKDNSSEGIEAKDGKGGISDQICVDNMPQDIAQDRRAGRRTDIFNHLWNRKLHKLNISSHSHANAPTHGFLITLHPSPWLIFNLALRFIPRRSVFSRNAFNQNALRLPSSPFPLHVKCILNLKRKWRLL